MRAKQRLIAIIGHDATFVCCLLTMAIVFLEAESLRITKDKMSRIDLVNSGTCIGVFPSPIQTWDRKPMFCIVIFNKNDLIALVLHDPRQSSLPKMFEDTYYYRFGDILSPIYNGYRK